MTNELYRQCPYCKSRDIGGTAALGSVKISCYKCHARTEFNEVGLHIKAQIQKYNTRPIEDKLRTQNAELVKALEEIREIYAGMDGFCPLTAPEAYQDKKLKEIWELARKALAKAKDE